MLAHVRVADTFNHKKSSQLRYIVNPPGSAVRVHQHLDIGQGEVDFEAAFGALRRIGFDGIVTSCGFLAIYQQKLAARLPVPVATSALLQVAMVARLLPAGQRVGVITFNGNSLGAKHLEGVGAGLDTPVVGLAEGGRFRRALLGDASVDGYAHRETEAVEAAERLVRRHKDVGAIVLECTNLVPHARAIGAATRKPVYDVVTLIRWFYAGLEQTAWPRTWQMT